jgi:hypothetical protein
VGLRFGAVDDFKAPVREALEAYAKHVHEKLVAAGHRVPPRAQRDGGWQAEGNDSFVYLPPDYTGTGVLVLAMDYHGTPEHRKCREALEKHPTIGPRLDTLVGSVWGLQRLDADQIPDRLLWTQLESASFDERAFAEEFEELYAWLVREHELFTVLAPLAGLDLERSPIPLGQTIEVDQLTDQEVGRCLEYGVLPGFRMGASMNVPLRAAVRIRDDFPILVGETDRPNDSASRIYQQWKSDVDSVLQALRLFKSGVVFAPGVVYFAESQDGQRSGPIAPVLPRPALSPTYRLVASEERPLRELWAALRSPHVQAKKRLGTALRRFALAGERRDPEDQIIDLMIAAEGLFLLPSERQESSYKISLRSAAFLGDAEPRSDVFGHMKTAYGARSTLAHGGELKPLKWADGTPAKLDEYADRVGGYLRLTVQRLIRAAANGDKLVTDDWDAFVLDRLR